MDIKITDNFIPKFFKEYQSEIYKVPWEINPVLGNPMCDEIDNFMLVHGFYRDNAPTDDLYYKFIKPLLKDLNIKSLLRVKMNLNPRTEKIIEHGFHNDTPYDDSFTSILYINTNNGYTKFEDGTIVESIENRLVTFPNSYKHTGTTCTDQSYRVVLNLNYF